jgi:hypothetical protein
MIDVNSIIHIQKEAFNVDKHTAVLCLQDHKKQAGAFEFKKDNIYSTEFAKSVGTVINNFTLTSTKQKDVFQVIENSEIQTPIITLQDIHKTQEPEIEIMYKTTEKLKDNNGEAIRSGTKLTAQELQDKGLDKNALLQEQKLMEIKIVK